MTLIHKTTLLPVTSLLATGTDSTAMLSPLKLYMMSAWLGGGSSCTRLWRRLGKNERAADETELASLLDGETTAAAAPPPGATATMRQLLPAFWRHFWPFLRGAPPSSYRGIQ